MTNFQVNGRGVRHAADDRMPLLWFLREVLRLKGTKFGCGIGVCGACTVLVDGVAAGGWRLVPSSTTSICSSVRQTAT